MDVAARDGRDGGRVARRRLPCGRVAAAASDAAGRARGPLRGIFSGAVAWSESLSLCFRRCSGRSRRRSRTELHILGSTQLEPDRAKSPTVFIFPLLSCQSRAPHFATTSFCLCPLSQMERNETVASFRELFFSPWNQVDLIFGKSGQPFVGLSNFKSGPRREIKRKKTCTAPRTNRPNPEPRKVQYLCMVRFRRPAWRRLVGSASFCGGDRRNVIPVNNEVEDTVHCRGATRRSSRCGRRGRG